MKCRRKSRVPSRRRRQCVNETNGAVGDKGEDLVVVVYRPQDVRPRMGCCHCGRFQNSREILQHPRHHGFHLRQ
jgi:hypothetical protein